MNSTYNLLLGSLLMPDPTILAGLFVATAIYAWWLNTPMGKWMRRDQTWVTVIIGNGIIVIAGALSNREFAVWMLWLFVAAGVPIIAESLYRMYRHHEATIAAQVGRDEQQ